MKIDLFDLTLEQFIQNFSAYFQDIDLPYNIDYTKMIQSISLNLYRPDIILIYFNYSYEIAYGIDLILMLKYMEKSNGPIEKIKWKRINLYIITVVSENEKVDLLSRYTMGAPNEKR